MADHALSLLADIDLAHACDGAPVCMSCCRVGMQPGKFTDDPPVSPAITNTFQAMLAWDSSRTFACFFYPTGGIQWAQAATMMGPAAVVRVCLCTACTQAHVPGALPIHHRVVHLMILRVLSTLCSHAAAASCCCQHVTVPVVFATVPSLSAALRLTMTLSAAQPVSISPRGCWSDVMSCSNETKV